MKVLLAYPPNPPHELVARLPAGLDLVACHYEGDHAARTAHADPPPPTAEQAAAFADAEVALAFDLPRSLRDVAPRLRWVQAIGAGVDHLRATCEDAGVTLTNAAGVAAGPIAEFVIGRLLAVWKRFDDLDELQRKHEWRATYGRVLAGCTVGVVGFGAIGSAVAERAAALGMRVVAVRRDPTADSPFADEVVGPDGLLDLLGRCDAVVLSAPATPGTEDLFDADAFATMRPGAVFCNVARGSLVDEDALLASLESGHLGAAILDVAKQEPLPPDSPLWDAPRLHLSPHSSTAPERYLETLFDLFADNLERYLRGDALRNVVDLEAGY